MISPLHARATDQLRDVLDTLEIPSATLRLGKPSRGDADAATGLPMQVSRALGRPPLEIAEAIAAAMAGKRGIRSATAAAPGYVNLVFDDASVALEANELLADATMGIAPVAHPERVLLDFGGPNIKPMHVGHLRSLVIGEALRRILGAVGHSVVSDIHLGDWGLPSGMVLSALRLRMPDAAWFGETGPFPSECPVSLEVLALLYPQAAQDCAADEERMRDARATTLALQEGHEGLNALWSLITGVAVDAIMRSCNRLDAHFDLFLGESDAQPELSGLIARLEAGGIAYRDGGALVMDVSEPSDRKVVPPLVLEKSDGCALYATTDLATLLARRRDLGVQRVLYVVDARQELHFAQVFRAAIKGGIAGNAALEHVPFGTVKGVDGKPLRTRSGGTMPLDGLLDAAREQALQRLKGGTHQLDDEEAMEAADAIGIAALKVADLASHRSGGYVLDLERALSFEGHTGPYLLYTVVRLRAILERAGEATGTITVVHPAERHLAMCCLGLGGAVHRAAEGRAPDEIVSWAFAAASAMSRFYADCPVLGEPDEGVRSSRIALCRLAEGCLSAALGLLGCRIPKAM